MKEFLEILGFTSNNGMEYQKEYALQKYIIKADISKGKIYYRKDEQTTIERQADGQIQLGDKTTSNFSQPENLVVLECVDRLLNKGYHPNDIHLERRYPSGRGASGGKSDVCVYGKDEKSLLVIECKTWGEEFEREKKKMDEHGGQLFAYLANDQNAKFLVLYASKTNSKKAGNDNFTYENLIVQIKDREEDLQKSLKQIEEENIKLYRDAKNKAELFEVWKESFNKYFHFNGIFDDDAIAYSLELKALKKKNLKSLDDSQGLFNKFAEILRHNNISDNANAFNKILSLFLCKIVDEEKDEEEVLDFQIREDEEYELLIDRLQALYQKGMKKLNEEVVYYSEKELSKIIKLYPNATPLEKLEEIFREIKYYTNNEFAFKEVHNKKLFIQNARVLSEVIKLLQNFRLRFTSKQQVLGDFFELLLNHGVKQSAGQFFTPIPVVHYIILSLGYENIILNKIAKGEEDFLPKILDYACGAGHFLTESVEEIQLILNNETLKQGVETVSQEATLDYENQLTEIYKETLSENYKKDLIKNFTQKFIADNHNQIEILRQNTNWAANSIFGIEKDYWLARTSQIACYINGDGEANIIFGDGLEEYEQLKLHKKKFDVVVANPPYSVEAFKNYLNVGKAHFDLFRELSERSSQIEALFIERTKQVLANNGVAGIILPSTILSNTGVYTKVREILLKHFEIKAITELGNKTFIATGTTTVILFLKRRNDDFLKDRNYIASDYFNHTQYCINQRYIDADTFLQLFCEHRNFDLQSYKIFLATEINEVLAETQIFKDYKNAFDNSTEIKKLKEQKTFKALSTAEQTEQLSKKFYFYCKDIEKEKFLYFMLCLGDGHKELQTMADYYKLQQTVIIKTGKELTEQREYLGYYFDGERGAEGIKITQQGGKLFDETNYLNPEKASSYVRKAMHNIPITEIHPAQEKNVAVYNLVDLIDFERVDFEKIIKTSSEVKQKISSKWDLVKLGDVAEIQSGGTPDSNVKEYWDGNINWATLVDTKEKYLYSTKRKITAQGLKNSSAKLLPINTVIFSSRATIGEVTISKVETATNQGYKNFICNPDKIIFEYLYYILKRYTKNIQALSSGATYDEISKTEISNFKIPLPPLEVQNQIVAEIAIIEKEEQKNLARVEKLQAQTTETMNSIGGKTVKLVEVSEIQKGTSITKEQTTQGSFPVVAGGQIPAYYHSEFNREANIITVSSSGAYAGFINFWQEKIFASDSTTIRTKEENIISTKLLFYILKNKQDDFYKLQKGAAQPHVYAKDFQNLEIPLPTPAEQQQLLQVITENETEIASLKQSLAMVTAAKEAVLKKYL
jgi:type I restriction enzyme M protein